MSKQRLVDAYEMLLNESEAYLSVQMSGKVSETTQMVNSVVHKKIQQLIADTPTIDPETLPTRPALPPPASTHPARRRRHTLH